MHNRIEKVLFSIDIYSVLGKFLHLKSVKNGFWALCPFHNDKNPSFFLNSSKKRYYCFACHKSGNVLNFLMDYKKISFRDAFKLLFKIIGFNYKIKVPFVKEFNLMLLISDIYEKNLKKYYHTNEDVRSFLIKRQIGIDLCNVFKIGFAENNFYSLSSTLLRLNFCKELLLSSGVFFSKNNFCLDRFVNRIIFPIRNIDGQVIAFGGRSLNDKFKPKYLNSSETFFFSKKKEFYGLYEAISACKCETIIIVEGYIDVITLYKYGITNVIAILGTAFTKEHFKKIRSIYKNIIFCYDGDNAGRIATIRTAFSSLSYLQYGNFIGFILLPNNVDPDSFLHLGFKNRFINFLKKPVYALDIIFNRINLKFGGKYVDSNISFFYVLKKF